MNKRKSQSWWDDPAEVEALARRTGHDVEKVRASLAGLKQLI
jgi:ABC-type taurine transport system substrate-binding protein